LKKAVREKGPEIIVFNRGITLFMSDDESIRRTHWVLFKLEKSGEN
jgi:hypothetical protein